MKEFALGAFDRFVCTAAACPDTCCVGWDVVIDDETAQKYRTLGGALGAELCSRMQVDADGDTVFTLESGRCPFLRQDGLCEIQRAAGENMLSVTCRRFPRIEQEYTDFKERCLSLACPEGVRLTLAEGALTVPQTVTEDADLRVLLDLRAELIRCVRAPHRPLGENLARCMTRALEWSCIDAGEFAEDALRAQFRFYASLDLMTDKFRALCTKPLAHPRTDRPTAENAAVYYLYRYLLHAVNDMDAALRVQWTLAAVLFLCYADAPPLESARLFSKEIEHSYENMERMTDALMQNTEFSPQTLRALCRGL